MAGKAYKGHKSEWGRDKGVKPGHPRDAGHAMHQPGQHHTSFESRGFHEDKGGTHPEHMRTNFTNRRKHDPDRAPTNVEGGHDPRPEHYHKNSGTECGGHQLVRRGGSVIKGMNRGL